MSPIRPPDVSSDAIVGVAARRLLADKPRSGRALTIKDDFDCSTASGSASDTPHVSPDPARRMLSKDSVEVCGPRTTVALQGIDKNYTRQKLLLMLDEEGFERCYDLVYLPVDFVTQTSLGYALVNLTSVDIAARFYAHFDELTVLAVSWSDVIQGLLPCVEWYRNSPVMHATVPDDFKPVLFADGVPVPFPPPTQPITAPKLRKCSPRRPPTSPAAMSPTAQTGMSPTTMLKTAMPPTAMSLTAMSLNAMSPTAMAPSHDVSPSMMAVTCAPPPGL
jgi:hypothetical protein